jgi:hypothetical protein
LSRKSVVDGLSKAELLERLEWVRQIVAVMKVMEDWPQVDRLRTIGTILAAMMFDADSDEDQVERIQSTVVLAWPGLKAGITRRMCDEEYLSQSIRAELAKLGGGSN